MFIFLSGPAKAKEKFPLLNEGHGIIVPKESSSLDDD